MAHIFDFSHAVRLGDALEQLRARRFDVILTDFNLPDAAGISVLEELQKEVPDTPIVVISGTSQDLSMALESLRRGAQDYLIKGKANSFVIHRSLRYAIERKQMEDALARSEIRLRQIIETTKDALIVMDAEGRITEWNPQAEKIFGWPRNEALGRLVADTVVPPRLRDGHRKGLARFLETGEAAVSNRTVELPALHRDGHQFTVEVSVSPFEIGNQRLFSAFIRDITERKRIEEEIRRQNALLQAMLDNMADGVVIADRNGRFLVFNSAAKRIIGLGITESPPEQWSATYGIFHPETSVPVASDKLPLVRAMRGEASDNVELLIRRPELGKDVYIQTTGRPLCDGNGEVYGGMTVFHNITAHKEAEQKLKQKNEELTHAYFELDESRRQQLELKDQVLSHVSHELRTPLTAAHQFVTILKRGLAGELQPQQKEYVDDIARNLKQLQTMIADLLEASRAESGKLTITLQPLAVQETVADIVRTLHSTAAEKGVSLRAEMPGELLSAEADPPRVRQVLTNLVDNALKFTPSGGSITIGARIFDRDPSFVRVSVTDTGRGIEPSQHQRIFSRLAQVDENSEESRKGLGLGLFICKEIIRRHGGEIGVESQLGSGSTFYFTLPRCVPNEGAAHSKPEDEKNE
jgi:PAS domain S-box-containing protein